MNRIIEAFYPYLSLSGKQNISLNNEKISCLVKNLNPSIGTAKAFCVICMMLDIDYGLNELFEKVGPTLEPIFGTTRCCSFYDGLKGGIPRRCEMIKETGFLYCKKHRLVDRGDCCEDCFKHCRGLTIKHEERWEHFGNVFENKLRPYFNKKATQSYASKWLNENIINAVSNEKKLKEEEITKPAITNQSEISKPELTKQPEKTKPVIRNDIESKPEKTKPVIRNDIESILSTSLLSYLITLIPSKIDFKESDTFKFRLYDDSTDYLTDGKIFKYRGDSEWGVMVDEDTVITKRELKEIENQINIADIKEKDIQQYCEKLSLLN